VIQAAGGPQLVALDLEKLGYVGRDGPYSGRTVRTWRAGARTPGADLLFALARYYELSLDQYAHGESPRNGLAEAIRRCEQERDRLRDTLEELAAADERYDIDLLAAWPAGQPLGSGRRRAAALTRARDLLW
jgi:hypothetical protein